MKRSSLSRYSSQSDYEDDKAAPSSSSPPPVREDGFQYDVFLSFRGPDTRNGFTGHLYQALQNKGIRTFIDSEKLEKGQKVKELFRYIETSKIYVPIFSKGYADSEWCLKEISKMVECKRLIIPVFFDVEPRDVRGQSGPFEPAFTRYGKNDITNKEEVRKWRNALTEAGEVSGYNLANTDGSEARLIKHMVNMISSKVNNSSLFVATHPVGLASRVAELVEMLKVEAQNDVKVVGIHGMGGIGKSTLARAVYNQIRPHFDASSFISDIRETTKQSKLVSLQEQLLREVLKAEKVEVNNIYHGTDMIMHQIKHKKVLLVLDDVDCEKQLDALAGSVDWFHSGSRIIITTRNKQVLIGPLRVENVYELKVLDDIQSLQLFCWHAFGKEEPEVEIAELSKEVAATAAGLPLALEIFGRHFHWLETNKLREDMLKKLKEDQEKDIHERLKISFDALDEKEKIVFLDIACFFVGEQSRYATFMWEERKLFPDLTIKVLIHKCLVNINKYTGAFEMHDHIRDMGRKIVEDESPNPENRSRLWQKDDILKVLREEKGTEKIEAINLSCEQAYPTLCVNTKSFAGMSQLKMLQLWNVSLEGKYEYFPTTLRWLSWNSEYLHFCNSKYLHCFPNEISLENIVVLDLCSPYTEQVWCNKRSGSTKVFSQLKVLSLRHCRRLTVCPDFTGMPHIEELHFEGCWALTELHPSIWRLTSLQVLDLSYCLTITALPSQPSDSKPLKQPCPDFSFMPYIEELDLGGCLRMTELHPSIWNLKRLTRLSLKGCHSLEEGFEKVWQLTSLEKLDLSHCYRITFPSRHSSSSNQPLPKLKILDLCRLNLTLCPNFAGMPHLEKLDFRGCRNLNELDPSIGHLKRLTHLALYECHSLKELPVEVWQLTSLQKLDLIMCYGITALPSQLKRSVLGKLKVMNLYDCKNLTICPDFTCMPHLEKLGFKYCAKLIQLCPSIGHLRSLTHLSLEICVSLKELPKEVWQLTSLEELDLSWCYGITALPSQLKLKGPMLDKLKVMNLHSCKNLTICPDFTCMPHIKNLDFSDCEKLTELHPSIGRLQSLTHLHLWGCKSLKELLEGAWQLTSLENLDLCYCCKIATLPSELGNSERLKQLFLDRTIITALPESIRHLEQLKHLSLNRCYSLKEIPEWIHSCISLEKLEAENCENLASFPNVLGDLRSLRSLNLSWTAIEELPCSFTSLEKLDCLFVKGCKRLKFLPQLPPSLTILDASCCSELEVIADVSKAIGLRELDLSECQKLVDVPGVEHLRGLRKLRLGGCSSLSNSFKNRVQEADFPNLEEELTIPASMEESSDARSHSMSQWYGYGYGHWYGYGYGYRVRVRVWALVRVQV